MLRLGPAVLLLAAGVGAAAQVTPAEVRAVFDQRREADYPAAAEAYLARIGSAGTSEAPAGLEEDLTQLALILPPQLAAQAVAGGAPGVGEALRVWWRRQDPLPATEVNERVVEHLLRVSTARAAFASDAPAGFDARGETFVRFGAPARRRTIDVENDLFIAQAIREEPSVRRTDFPRNEVWHYPALGPDVFFVFIERRGAYEEADPLSLIPPALQAGGISTTTAGRARLLGQTLRWVYKDLATYSAAIRNRLLTLDSTIGGDGVAFSGNTALTLQTELQRARREDAEARVERDGLLPPSATSVRQTPFGITHHAAVFLDGAPGAETYAAWVGWAQTASRLTRVADSLGTLGLQPEGFMIGLTGVAYGPGYDRSAATERLYLLEAPERPSVPAWSMLDQLTPGAHAAFEWDLYPATRNAEILPPGAVAADVLWLDSLRVAWAGRVGLSGALPVDAREALSASEVDRLGRFPQAQVTVAAGESVAVYYEVYTEEPGVEVEVEVRAVKIREGRILRPGRDVATASSSRFLLEERRRPELAVLEIDDLTGVDQLRIDIVATDVGAALSTSQSVTFDLR